MRNSLSKRLAIVASHPIQYQAPIFRALSKRLDLEVFYAHRASASDQSVAGFGVGFDWDIDLLSGYESTFLNNVARRPGLDHFSGCDTPSVGNAIDRFCPDGVLVLGWHLKAFLQAVFAAKRRGIRVLVRGDSQLATPRSLPKRAIKELIYPAGLRVFDAALYVGERSRLYWDHYRYPESRLFFSPHCVDNEWFSARADSLARESLRSAHGLAADDFVVLFAGKLIEKKRPTDAVLATAELAGKSKRRVVLLIAGSGPLESSVSSLARDTGVNLVKLGFCNQSEMPAAYAASDVLVLPSDGGETWGLVANEALACGRPIVVSDACGCAPDLAADGHAGRTFPVTDMAALAGAIQEILVSPPSEHQLAERASRYGISAAVDGVVEALAQVTGGRHSA